MPDPTRATISATESAALFDASPYTTRWMLYCRFALGQDNIQIENARMDWGKKLEPLILEQASQDLKFQVVPNKGPDGNQIYIRNGLLGCTRDAEIICPERGPGACETKCVFDYRIWMQDWDGGNKPPRHHEIQLQQQMKVGDGKTSYKWGVEVVWVAGELYYFERQPIPKFWTALDGEAERFFEDVAASNEPEPFGSPREYPLLKEVFPTIEKKVLDLREAPEGHEIAEVVRLYDYHRKQRIGHEKGEDAIKLKLLVIGKDSDQIMLPHGINVKLKQNKTGVGIKAYVPADLEEGGLDDFEGVNLGG